MRAKKRGIWKRLDGANVRFQLDRKNGLRVRRGRRRPEHIITWRDLLDLAEGQTRMNLL